MEHIVFYKYDVPDVDIVSVETEVIIAQSSLENPNDGGLWKWDDRFNISPLI